MEREQTTRVREREMNGKSERDDSGDDNDEERAKSEGGGEGEKTVGLANVCFIFSINTQHVKSEDPLKFNSA